MLSRAKRVNSLIAVVKKRDETRGFISLFYLLLGDHGRGVGQVQSDPEFYGSETNVSIRYCPNLDIGTTNQRLT